MKFALILLATMLTSCGEFAPIDSCATTAKDIHTMSWKHEDYGDPGVSYTLYYDYEPIFSTTQKTVKTIVTTELSVPFDPLALNIPECATVYFRVIANYANVNTPDSDFSNEVGHYMNHTNNVN